MRNQMYATVGICLPEILWSLHTLKEIKKDLSMFWLRFSLLFKLAYLGKADMPKKYMLYQNIFYNIHPFFLHLLA